MHEPEKRSSLAPSSVELAAGLRSISSEDLLRGERQVVILHNGEAYRLLVTRNDKLLLQK